MLKLFKFTTYRIKVITLSLNLNRSLNHIQKRLANLKTHNIKYQGKSTSWMIRKSRLKILNTMVRKLLIEQFNYQVFVQNISIADLRFVKNLEPINILLTLKDQRQTQFSILGKSYLLAKKQVR